MIRIIEAGAVDEAIEMITGRYETVSGTVLSTEMGTLRLTTEAGELKISFDVIREITGSVFDTDWELCCP